MVGGLLWGCSLFSSAFFYGFFVFFWQGDIGFLGLCSALWLGFFGYGDGCPDIGATVALLNAD